MGVGGRRRHGTSYQGCLRGSVVEVVLGGVVAGAGVDVLIKCVVTPTPSVSNPMPTIAQITRMPLNRCAQGGYTGRFSMELLSCRSRGGLYL